MNLRLTPVSVASIVWAVAVVATVGLATDSQGGPTPRNVGVIGGHSPVAVFAMLPVHPFGSGGRSPQGRGPALGQVANLPTLFPRSNGCEGAISLYAQERRSAMSAALTPAVVPFHGDELLTVKVNDTPYIPMKPIVEGLGLTWGAQQKKLRWNGRYSDIAIPIQTASGVQDMLCIPLRKLNGWLFSVNPSKVRDDVRPKLIAYQEECFEVLYRYWHGETDVSAGLVSRTFAPDLQNRVWYEGKPVLASSTLAVYFGCDAKTLSNIARDTRGLFQRGTHFHVIEGEEVKRFYTEAMDVAVSILPPVPPVHGLTLFPDEGARYLALSLGRSAQDAYLHLRRTYYATANAWDRPGESINSALQRAEQLLGTLTGQVSRMNQAVNALRA